VSIAADAPVAPETALFRRVSPAFDIARVKDEDKDCLRLSSAVFKTKNQRLSVVIEDKLEEEGREPLDVLADYPDDFLIAIDAGIPMNQGHGIERTPEDHEPAHAEIVGKVSKGQAREMCEMARWIKAPEDLCPEEQARIESP
jgi:hypothetical protein